MKLLSYWLKDANALDELAYCAKHPYPILVHNTSSYQLRPVSRVMATIDRAVLSPVRRGYMPSAIDEYMAVPVRAQIGDTTFELRVGCLANCDVTIDDVTVSKLHALMTRDARGYWYVQDVGSTTGTHVNEQDTDPTRPLQSGDKIAFGLVEVTFHLPASHYALVRRLI
jgi:hypothetical protein